MPRRNTMKYFVSTATLLVLASLAGSAQPANAGLGALSSPQRTRCENQASAKIAMWQWFARQDFINRCMSATGTTGGGKAKGKSKKISVR
jgi:hypothetical protein